jgi:acetyltransferase-like isoleucine patch superfamily enzyme
MRLMSKFKKSLKNNIFFRKIIIENILKIVWNEPMIIGPKERLHISKKSIKNNYYVNTNSGNVYIGDNVFFGKNVCIITGTHDYNKFNKDRIEGSPYMGVTLL